MTELGEEELPQDFLDSVSDVPDNKGLANAQAATYVWQRESGSRQYEEGVQCRLHVVLLEVHYQFVYLISLLVHQVLTQTLLKRVWTLWLCAGLRCSF